MTPERKKLVSGLFGWSESASFHLLTSSGDVTTVATGGTLTSVGWLFRWVVQAEIQSV